MEDVRKWVLAVMRMTTELHTMICFLLLLTKKDFSDLGERLLLGILHSRGISCSRETLRQVVHDVDLINTALCCNAKLCRRTYSVPGPNTLWHIGKFQVAI